ncbi:IclR family transcriptional regulator [Achromobacter insolitus]|uniref:Transcriptional regulator KdgR n=2 Tax=Achromobacter insolitus TaxID=217204 RepID=A0A6S7EW61_9BURK|nr:MULTISPECIES: IclR family transcriptional regulator [Achromobacter]GLK93481.1 transcriptional regulator [Achromobacter xylosoxidans]AXA70103.1 IclR family transcriptional regulator [Achromobacter insolitus]MEB3097075.1 IclR family transcriptional regulator [Achromobacter sp. D10]OAE50221.1 IclR family transcriptional regulator [Achromobacter insolitus]OCZ51126.1 IclR family transcriptional regulator [Achromobacter insolitus]
MEVKLVARTLELIELFAQVRRPMPLTELAQGLGAPMSSCLALVRTLVARGYLYEVRRRAGYYPTPKLHALCGLILSGDPWMERVRPQLAMLRDAANETVMLGKIQDGAVLFLDVAESTHPVHYGARPGARRPLHTSAVAKAILARLAPAERDSVLASADYERYTDRTLVTRQALLAEVELTAARGWAENAGESVADLTGLAVALDLGGEWYALCLAGPTSRVAEKREENLRHLRDAVEAIRLGREG